MSDGDVSAKDKRAARDMNDAWRLRNLAPVGTAAPATTVVRHISMPTGCDCDCRSFCAACKAAPEDDVA